MHEARISARLMAVQALYQMDIAATSVDDIVAEFEAHRLDAPDDESLAHEADKDYFGQIVRGVAAHREAIDAHIAARLAEDWTLARLDSTLRAILQCGVFELVYGGGDVPPKALVAQYTDLAHAFFEGAEGGMANALLDRVAHAVADGVMSDG